MRMKNCTSVKCTFHVELSLVRLKIFRSCFLSPIVELADLFANVKIIALTRDFFVTSQIALFRPSNLVRFKRVTSEEHSVYRVLYLVTLASSFKYTNPGHEKRNWEPELCIHIGMNASMSLLQRKESDIINNSFRNIMLLLRPASRCFSSFVVECYNFP